ncbi:MAG: IS21 family transposase [Candidatus Aerophobetes bacterium]|nr:IS21 family transposase [Candidatus Aerophobetes bacterium]
MRKIRELVRLHEECGLSNRQIARALNISRPVVADYLVNFKLSGLTYRSITTMSDDEVMRVLETRRKERCERYRILSEKFPYLVKELKKPGVTLELLWQEYQKQYPQGYSYSQFCYHFRVWHGLSSVSMHLEHKAGEKMFVDYTGKKLKICERTQGKEKEVEVFVAILPASQLTYVEATETQRKEDWLKANEHALFYFEGVPQQIVPDCLKSAVTKGNKYEPDINPVYADFARHYGTAVVPARPHNPKDKAMVENAVKITYRRVFAPLRDRLFHSVKELNEAIRDLLEEHNNTPFQRIKMSRRNLFDEIEKAALKPLPRKRYELKEFRRLKVPPNYHIEIREDNHYYSVPWQYKGKDVTVIYTASVVEIYHRGVRIALHRREEKRGYTTLKEHMPAQHRFYAQQGPQEMITQAKEIGDKAGALVEKIFESKGCLQLSYRTCLGIIDLSRRYGTDRLNRASGRALEFHSYSYKAASKSSKIP